MTNSNRLGELADEIRVLSPKLARLEREHAEELAIVRESELSEYHDLARKAHLVFRGVEIRSHATLDLWSNKIKRLLTRSHSPHDMSEQELEKIIDTMQILGSHRLTVVIETFKEEL